MTPEGRFSLPLTEPSLGADELRYLSDCIQSGWVSSAGPFVQAFETAFAGFCGVSHAVATASGTAALHLALLALGVGPGDEVLVPTLTFVATANAVSHTGALPVFIDSERNSWTIDPDQLEKAITPRTKAVIPVHLYGHPAEMDRILEVAARHQLAVIEDASEAHGARYKGKRVGGLGDVAAFSFYGSKIITTGEGGMVVTDRADLAEKMQVLRDHGRSRENRYEHPVRGFNYRMSNVQAALGLAQMKRIDEHVTAKRRIAQAYGQALCNIPGLTLPPQATWAENVYWLYSILVDKRLFGATRDGLVSKLWNLGIEARPIFFPLHRQPIYQTGQSLPVAEQLAEQGISLPSSTRLGDQELERVVQAILSPA